MMRSETATFGKMKVRRPLTLTALLSYLQVITVFLYLPLSTQILLLLRWHYVGGGSGVEKLHPATYLLFVILSVSLFADQRFRHLAIGLIASDLSLAWFAGTIVLTALYTYLMAGASLSPFVDTFLAAIVTAIIIIAMPRRSLSLLGWLVDIFFIVNIVMIFSEVILQADFMSQYFRAVIRTPEELVVLGPQGRGTEYGRLAGVFGHPLNAALLLGIYSISILVSTPMQFSVKSVWRVTLAFAAYLAIFPTGSRSSMIATTTILLLYIIYSAFRGRTNTAALTFAFFGGISLAILGFFLWSGGFFDPMLNQFDHDYGSALSRDYALEILNNSSPSDVLFGLSQEQLNSLAASLNLGEIEISWINFILAGGLITAIPLFVTLCLFLFFSLPRYCHPGIYFVSLLILESTGASNSIWSKTTAFTSCLIVGLSFLRRDSFDLRSHARSKTVNVTARSPGVKGRWSAESIT